LINVRNFMSAFKVLSGLFAVVLVLAVVGCGGGSSTTTPPPQNVSVTVSPTSASVQTGASTTFTATVTGSSNTAVTWQVNGVASGDSTHGSIDSTGKYTAPATVPSPAAVTVTAVAAADSTKSANAAVTVTAVITGNVSVTVSPTHAALSRGQAQTFTPAVTGTTSTNVTWEVDSVAGGNATVGTVDANGVYTPSSTTTPGAHTLTARSVADTTASASASVAVTDLTGVFTYHNDLSRDGVNSKEYALNTTNVNSTTFGKVFACSIDAAAYAQPLWVASVQNIGGGTHNVLIAATQHDTVYAFDADASPCHTHWSKSLLASGETWGTSGDVGSADITPDIGIVGTPVIDPSSNTLYVVSKSKLGSTFHQRLHALNLADGSEKFNGPKEITFTSGNLTFNPLTQNDRAGLALVNGVVYIAYASHGDNPTYYGWVVGYNASTLAQVSLFNDDPTGAFGGIWMSGGAPAADASNNLYVITGNGVFNGTTEFGDSFLRLATSAGITVSSFFSPSNQANLDATDGDLGAGGAAILVDLPTGPNNHLLIGGGKDGNLYLLNRDNLGGNTNNNSGAVQVLPLGKSIFSTAAFWQNTMYIGPVQSPLRAYTLNPAGPTFGGAVSSQGSATFGFPGTTPSVSAQGTANGIVWAIEFNNKAVLHAYDATNLATELWNSGGTAGLPVKFTVPTIANGKVYVGTATEISVFGLTP
jgi:hypothetical protein